MPAFTPRNVARFVAHNGVKFYVAGLAHNTITDHTRFDDDDFIVDAASSVIGWGVADITEPITNKIVDKVADWFIALKDKKQQDTIEVE